MEAMEMNDYAEKAQKGGGKTKKDKILWDSFSPN